MTLSVNTLDISLAGSAQSHKKLLSGTALASLVAAGLLSFSPVVPMMASTAFAVNECGGLAFGQTSIDCVGTFNAGITYNPSSFSFQTPFTLTVGDGVIGSTNVFNTGVSLTNLLGSGTVIVEENTLIGGVPVGINVLMGGNATGINNGFIINAGTGINVSSITGDATATNGATGTITSVNNGIVSTAALGNASGTNAGSVESQNGSGIVVNGTVSATGTNSGTITANNGFGVTVGSGGTATATNTADGIINSGDNGIQAVSILGNAEGTNNGSITSTGGDGIFVGAVGTGAGQNSGSISAAAGSGIAVLSGGEATATNTDTGTIESGDDGIIAASLAGNAQGTNNGSVTSTAGNGISVAALGTGTANNTGLIDTSAGTGTGIAVLSGGDATATNSADGDIDAGGDGISIASAGGNALATNSGSIDAGGIGMLAVSGGGDATTINTSSNSVMASTSGMLSIVLPGATGTAFVDNDGGAVNTTDGIGLGALNFGTGDANVENNQDGNGDGGTVVADDLAGNGIGIAALALDGSVDIDSTTGSVTSGSLGIGGLAIGGTTVINSGLVNSGASGVIGAAFGGDTTITTHNTVNADGLFGVAGFSDNGAQILLQDETINNNGAGGGIGVIAVSGSGNADIEGEASTVNALTQGIIGVSLGGGSTFIDSGTVNAGGSGVIGASLGGNVGIGTFGTTNANGLFGVAGFATGDVTIDLLGQTVNNNGAGGGAGVVGIGGGTVDIEGEGSIINSDDIGMLGVSLGGNVFLDAGEITSDNGSGVIGVSLGGDVDVDTFGKISADNGLIGAGALSIGGNASVVVGGDIDPPIIGAGAVSIGVGNANVDVLDGNFVEADLIGLLGVQFGDGDVNINVGEDDGDGDGSLVLSGGAGILAIKSFGEGDVNINVTENSSVVADSTAVTILAGTIGPDENSATLNNDGIIQGNGFFSPVIFAATDGGVTINNSETGIIQGEEWAIGALVPGTNDPLGAFEPLIVTVGGPAEVNNDGGMFGTVFFLSGDDNVINNNGSGVWETGGINFLGFGANDAVNNTGRVQVHLTTAFLGLENFNNDGGLLSSQDGEIDEFTFIEGNFNGSGNLAGGSVLAFDAALTPGGTADVLLVGEDVSGVTFVDVNDLDGGPGQFDPNGVLFAQVNGNTDESNFTTDGGIDKGLFRYDAYLRPDSISGSGENEWVLASTLDREAFEFPFISAGAASLWNLSTGTWLDRTADLRSAFGETIPESVDLKSGDVYPGVSSSITPGVWIRGFGGYEERDYPDQVVSAPPPGLLGPTYTYDDTTKQTSYGVVIGADFGSESVTQSGANQAWLFGIMAGYGGSQFEFENSSTDFDYNAGLIGAYVTYLNGGFFIDAVVKADIGSIDYSTDAGGGFMASESTNYNAIGGVVDTGYRFNAASGFFFEPKGTLSYVRTDVDDMTVLGTGIEFDDGDSFRGRLGARLGAQLANGATLFEPFVEGNLWHEFDGDYSANLVSNGFTVPVNQDLGGTFGEVVLGANVFNNGTGWNGFAKGAVQFGEDNYLGFTGNIGLRKAL